ncbi:MAG: hypothetical protein QOE45_1475 [Frankiaceae bacterium]|nr:hypothetical protein [Frankiaceae bacterium]
MSVVDDYAPLPPPAVVPRRGPLAPVAAGLGAAVAGALVWFALAVLLDVRLALVGLAIGVAVAWAVRRAGGGTTPAYGALAAALALLGCALGHLLEEYARLARYLDTGLGYLIRHAPVSLMRELWLRDASFFTWLIFGLAAFTAFRGVVRPRR